MNKTRKTRTAVLLELELPRVPNYLRIKDTDETVDVKHLTSEELHNIAEAWKDALIANAVKREKHD